MNELGWMALHLRCLYHHDENERITQLRQPNGWEAPLFHLGRTRLGNLWRFRDDLEPAVVRELSRLAAKEGPLQPGHAPPERMETMRAVLHESATVLREWRGPAFHFEGRLPEPPDPAGEPDVVAVTPDDRALLAATFVDTIPELAERQPCFAAVEGGQAVSLCESARPLEVRGSPTCPAAEAGVQTLPAHRGRGLAPQVVAAWARAVRARGGEPMYSTSWDNKASRAVARKLGLVCYGEDLHFA